MPVAVKLDSAEVTNLPSCFALVLLSITLKVLVPVSNLLDSLLGISNNPNNVPLADACKVAPDPPVLAKLELAGLTKLETLTSSKNGNTTAFGFNPLAVNCTV